MSSPRGTRDQAYHPSFPRHVRSDDRTDTKNIAHMRPARGTRIARGCRPRTRDVSRRPIVDVDRSREPVTAIVDDRIVINSNADRGAPDGADDDANAGRVDGRHSWTHADGRNDAGACDEDATRMRARIGGRGRSRMDGRMGRGLG